MTTIKKEIRDKILTDKEMSSEGALILDIRQHSFEMLARRNSDKLGHKLLCDMYVKYGFDANNLFEEVKPETQEA